MKKEKESNSEKARYSARKMNRIVQYVVGILILVVVLYAFVQPRANRMFGWNLPSLPIGQQIEPQEQGFQKATKDNFDKETPTAGMVRGPRIDVDINKQKNNKKNPNGGKSDSPSTKTKSPNKQSDSDKGKLKEISRDVLMSPAGLVYRMGPNREHRIDHVMRHSKDQPNRSGKHGVFDGSKEVIVAVIDEAYLLAKNKSRQAKTTIDRNRVIHEVDMKRRIGYVGGKVGNERGKPAVKRVKLVLEGKNVITAYPF